MKHLKLMLLSILFSQSLFAGPPTEFLSNQVAEVRKLVDQAATNDSDQKALDAQLLALVRPLMNFPKLSEAALRKHWPTLKEEEKQKFVSLFEDLVFQNYLKRVRSANKNYTIAYVEEESKENNGAFVTAEAKAKITVELGFDLIPQANTQVSDQKYEAKDVVIDGVSLVENYRDQFNAIIAKDGFDALLGKMQVQIDKLKGGSKSSVVVEEKKEEKKAKEKKKKGK